MKIFLIIINIIFLQIYAFGIDVKNIVSPEKGELLQLENNYLQINLSPNTGGRIMILFFKPANVNLVDPEAGCLTDNIWNIPASRFFLNEKPYEYIKKNIPNGIEIKMEANASGGGIDFLDIIKSVKVYDNNAALTIDYQFRNMPQAMSALDYGFWFHNTVGVIGQKATYYYPCDKGIKIIPPEKQITQDRWFYRPARGWCAAAVPGVAGIAMIMDYAPLKCFYSWYGKTSTVPSLEWRFEKMTLKENETFSTQVRMIPFYGLPTVSGAGQYVVGSIEVTKKEIEAGDIVPINITLYSAIKQHVQLDVRIKKVTDNDWNTICKKEMEFDSPATIKKARAEYKTTETGGYAIEVIISNSNGEIARLNSLLVCDELDGVYTISHLTKRIKARKQNIDLTKYDWSIKTDHIKWAEPYCRRKIKVLALTGYQNIREIAELAQRISIEPHTSFLAINHRPIFLIGNDYGRTTQNDLIDNLNKKLNNKYDVIIIGGVPWDYFPKDIQLKIIKMVKDGTGLVYIDPTSKNNGLDKISSLFNNKDVIKGVPHSVKNSFLTAGIPFNIFPPCYIRESESEGTVLAKVNNTPYLVARKIGKGNVVSLAYKTLGGILNTGPGLTPDFRYIKEIHNNYWEYYFSLLSKSIIYAADLLPPVKIISIESKERNNKTTILLKLSSENNCPVSFHVTNLDKDFNLLKATRFRSTLKAGENNISLSLPKITFAGQQIINIIIKDKNNKVLNWGTVGIKVEPTLKLSAIKTDKKFYKYGEYANIEITTDGVKSTNQIVSCDLFDSHGRCLFRKMTTPGNATFKIPLTNKLLSRFYTIKATLFDNKNKIDIMRKELIVTPPKEQLVWDDYEPGIWLTSFAGMGMRSYLLPELAGKLHELKMKIIIANYPDLGVDFAIKHNFNPTILQNAGLSRCEEPIEYLRTGNKLKLIRKPCLSDPAFIKQRKNIFTSLGKEMQKYALRFYWLGDEQSITGYSGKPIDFCFSKYCLDNLRKELKREYNTIDNLNKEWGTYFRTWHDVLPMTRQEAWMQTNGNYAAWSDHLAFMDSRLEFIVNLAKKSFLENDANAKVSISGTQPPTAYGGMDWWRLMKSFDGVMNYSEGGQRDLQRSFKPDGDTLNWGIGYSYKGSKVCYNIWESLFMGEKGIMAFHLPSLVNPDMTFSDGAKDAIASLTDLTGGIGKHFINNLHTSPGIAILYSQASIRAAFINKQRKQHTEIRQKYINLCRNTGVSFRFISYEQLAQGILDNNTYKILILPDSTALSNKEVDAIRRFAQKNMVIAEGIPAIMDEHCKTLMTSPLINIFDDNNSFLDEKIDVAYNSALLYPDTDKNKKIIKEQQQLFLNRLENAGIKPGVIITDSNGVHIRNAGIYQKRDSNNNKYICIIAPTTKPHHVLFTFPDKSYIYELRTGKYFGYTDSIRLFLSESTPYVFALLDKQPGKLNIEFKNNGLLKKIILNRQPGIDSVVNMQVFDPHNKKIDCYEKNILLRNGIGESSIPFALNDKKGDWTIIFKDIVTGQSLTNKIRL